LGENWLIESDDSDSVHSLILTAISAWWWERESFLIDKADETSIKSIHAFFFKGA
jgi:hypothetical protein